MAPLLILAALLMFGAPTACRRRCVPGAPCNVSTDDSSVLKVALSAAEIFNNQSDDSFLFKPQRVIQAQRQVVKGVRFLLDLDLCRTVCRKRDPPKNLQDCVSQAPGPLQQVLCCHIEVWNVPWSHRSVTQRFFCKNLRLNQSERREGSLSQSERREGSLSQSERREGSLSQSEGSLSQSEGSLSQSEGSLSQSERREGSLSQSEGSLSQSEGSLSQSERREGSLSQSERREGSLSQSERREGSLSQSEGSLSQSEGSLSQSEGGKAL